MTVTAGKAFRTLTKPTPWSAALLLVAGAVALFIGYNLGQTADALFDRTENVVATVDLETETLGFTTWSGQQVSAPMISKCKERDLSSGSDCAALYQTGDEVRISYDPLDPTRVWVGETPGGGVATLLLALGVSGVVAGALGLWWMVIQPRLARLFSSTTDVLPQQRRPDDHQR